MVGNRKIQRSFWFILGCIFVLWIILGIALPRGSTPMNDLFDVVSLSAFFAAVLFVVIYTIAGFIKTSKARWWTNEVGTYLVLAIASTMSITGPTAFAVLFNGGLINTWWWAWTWVGGHALFAITVVLLSWLWVRNFSRQPAE